MKVPVYGSVMVDDPRDFTPDEECSTEEERAAWREAVRLADAGEWTFIPKHFEDADGARWSLRGWGLGVNMVEEEEDADPSLFEELTG